MEKGLESADAAARMQNRPRAFKEFVTDFKEFSQRKAKSSRDSDLEERENEWQCNALRDYFRNYSSNRSSNFDDSNRVMSVMDENEPNEVMAFVAHEANITGNVWGDIYRNSFLKSVNNPPNQLSRYPGTGDENPRNFHPNIDEEKLRASRLWSSFRFGKQSGECKD